MQEIWLGGGDLILTAACDYALCCCHVFNHLTTVAFLDISKRKNRRMRL
jgi:peptide deformylase